MLGECKRGKRRWGIATAVLGALLVLPAGAAAGPPPAGSTWSEGYFPSTDGTTLHADVFRPERPGNERRTPVMLVVSPYVGLPDSFDLPHVEPPTILSWYRRLYETAIARGFSIVQVSIRGTGASHGCEDLGGPGEQGDVRAAVRWARSRPWSSGRVGMIGHSYDGYLAVSALAQHLPIRAAVLMAPAFSQYRAAYMNGVAYLQSHVIAPYYQAFALIPPLSSAAAGAIAGRDLTCAASTVAQAQNSNPNKDFWRERDFSKGAAGSRVPVLWTHGFLDGRDDESAVRPDNFLKVWKRLRGPRQAWFGQFPHVVPGELGTFTEPEPVGRGGFPAKAVDWLAAYVAHRRGPLRRVHRRPVVAVQEGARGRWRGERRWPPRGLRKRGMRILPGSYLDGPGNKAEAGEGPGGSCNGIQARCNPLSHAGQGTWTFSQPLARSVQLAGVSRISARLEASAATVELVAIVYDVDRNGNATMLTRGASLTAGTGRVRFNLYPQDWRLRAGHRLGVLLAGSDDFYFAPGTSLSTVQVTGGRLRVPLLRHARPSNLNGGPSQAVLDRTTFAVAVDGRVSRLKLPRRHPLR